MDPLSLMKVFWKHRWLALPAIVIVLSMAFYVVFFGPRTYESSAIYVVVHPDTPTDLELQRSKRLSKLNSDNPYLRAADPGLITQVIVAKMSAQSTEQDLEAAGLSTEYSVAVSPQSDMTVIVSAFASTPEGAIATRQWLLDSLSRELYGLQKINGADDRFLFVALPVDMSSEPVEKISSRLRSLIVVLVAGAILVMGVVSVGAAFDRRHRPESHVEDRTFTASATTIRPESRPANSSNGVVPSIELARLHPAGPAEAWPLLPDQNRLSN
jgi:hypothetical protein